jgi:hypothetical protein
MILIRISNTKTNPVESFSNRGQWLSARGDDVKMSKNNLIILKNHFFKNQQANFNQNWYKSFIGKGN